MIDRHIQHQTNRGLDDKALAPGNPVPALIDATPLRRSCRLLGVPRRERVVTRIYRVRVADPTVASMGDDFATA